MIGDFGDLTTFELAKRYAGLGGSIPLSSP
jgi:hypothetical protein